MTPDIAAVADPFTGVKIVLDDQIVAGGGTSQSAPIWAGLTALMNQYLLDNGGTLIGDINPLLYRIAQGAPRPAFRDVTLGGNAVDLAAPGYDLVTGLGTPDVDNLVRNLQLAQRWRPDERPPAWWNARSARSMCPQANTADCAASRWPNTKVATARTGCARVASARRPDSVCSRRR